MSNFNNNFNEVWLKFENDTDEEPTFEANTFKDDDGDYVIEWSHTAVGQITAVYFNTLEEAHAWYEENGYQDFTS